MSDIIGTNLRDKPYYIGMCPYPRPGEQVQGGCKYAPPVTLSPNLGYNKKTKREKRLWKIKTPSRVKKF